MTNTRPDFVIYGSPLSPFVRKVAGVAIEKDAPFEIEQVNVFDPPQWFRDISPMKRIPVLRDRSIAEEGMAGTLADSSAICAMIEKKHPASPLYPDEPHPHGQAIFIEEYADTALAMVTGMGIFRPIFFAAAKGKEPDHDKARGTWNDDMPPVLDRLETMLDGRDHFVGDTLSIADISVTCVLMQAALVANMDLRAWPALEAHHAAMSERPSIAGPYGKADAAVRKSLPERFDLT